MQKRVDVRKIAFHQLPDANFFGWRLFFLPWLARRYERQSKRKKFFQAETFRLDWTLKKLL